MLVESLALNDRLHLEMVRPRMNIIVSIETHPRHSGLGIETRPERCAACHLCVLACSFHHEGAFGRRGASIDILKNEREGDVEIIIFGEGQNGRKPCDGCVSEDKPLCIVWCPAGALLARKG